MSDTVTVTADDRRLTLFKTVLNQFSSTQEITADDFQNLEEVGEFEKCDDECLKEIQESLFDYLQNKMSDKSRLLDTLLKILNAESLVRSIEITDSTLLFRCGCVVYTLFYQLMLDKNNISRFGQQHSSLAHASSEASFRRNLQNHAMKETVDAIKILEAGLSIVVSGNQEVACRQCVIGFYPFNSSKVGSNGEDKLSKEVLKVVDVDLAQTVLFESRSLSTTREARSFTLLTKNGGIRKSIKRKVSVEGEAIKLKESENRIQTSFSDNDDDDDNSNNNDKTVVAEIIGMSINSSNANISFASSFIQFKGKDFFVKRHFLEGELTPNEQYLKNKLVVFELKHYLTSDMLQYVHLVLLNKAEKMRNSSQRFLKIRNNYRRKPLSDDLFVDDKKRIAYTSNFIGLNNGGKRYRSCDGQSENDLIEFSQVINWILSLVKEAGEGLIVPNEVFPCASSGVMNSLNLIVALPECSAQHFHYDYDHKTFGGSEFKGASLFINFQNEWASLDIGVCEHNSTIRKQQKVPPLSVFVFRGDFKHAGSANLSLTDEVWKYFMYLDPIKSVGTFRKDNSDILYYDQHDDLSYILWPEERKLFEK
jgi:hypothetical protein